MAQSIRAKARASARRAAQRGSTLGEGTIKCPLCDYRAHSLVGHFRTSHQIDAMGIEEQLGMAIGSLETVSPSLKAHFAETSKAAAAVKKAAAQTAA